jgi:hypothetical protein
MNQLAGLSLVLSAWAVFVAPPVVEDTKVHEQTLTASGVKTDTPALLDFFRKRTLADAERERLARLVQQLGADQFSERVSAQETLIKAGRKAVALLTPAVRDPDLEIARRARQCLQAIEAPPETDLLRAAAALLAARRAAGTLEVLLAFLPSLEDDSAEEDLFRAIERLGFSKGKAAPPLVSAIRAKTSRQRAAAAWALGRSTEKADRDRVFLLLRDDAAAVRYRAAEALVVGRDARGVPALIAQIEEGPLELAWQAESLLSRLAGEHAPREILSVETEVRQKCRLAWRTWWRERGAKLDLAKLDLRQTLLGLRLVVANSGYGGAGAVWEYGVDRKNRWEMRNVGGPFDARLLPGGRVLLAEYNQLKVTERDRAGKILWEFTTGNAPLEVQRLPNGNTVITTNYEIVEVTRDGRRVFTHRDPGGNLFSGQKLTNGHFLYGLYSGWVVELDRTGKEVRRFGIERPRGLANILVLPSGNYLMPLAGSGRIVELDRTGKVVWEVTIASPTSVAVLPGGNLLVGSHILNTIREIDRKGKVLWEHKAEGQVFRVHVR